MNLYENIKKNLKMKHKSAKLNEAVDMNKLRAARERELKQKTDDATNKRQQIMDNISEAYRKLKAYGYDNLIEIGNFLQEIGVMKMEPDQRSRTELFADGIRHNFGYKYNGYTGNNDNPVKYFAVEGGGACGDNGIIFKPDEVVFTDENCREEKYHDINDIPDVELRGYLDRAETASERVDEFIAKVEQKANEYTEKYPELEDMVESCGKKKRKHTSLRESNPAFYLGCVIPLNEKVNHANDDINAKIREALRSKAAAKKYADEFKNLGITIDDDQREGVTLIGPNGRRLSADRLDIQGPARPGHNQTHGSRSRYGYSSAKSKKQDLDNYNKRIAEQKEEIENLKNAERDDIIRKYPNLTTDEALDANKRAIEATKDNLEHSMKWRKGVEEDLHEIHKNREQGHNEDVNGYNRYVSRKSKSADSIDYKGYLDSKNTDENKDLYSNGNPKLTKGQQVRREFKDAKNKVDNTYYFASDARDDINNKNINAKSIENRKKEIEEEYKKKMDDEVNSMLKKKSDADASYKEHKKVYGDNVKALNDFRKKHNLPTKDEDSFEDYAEKKSKLRW